MASRDVQSLPMCWDCSHCAIADMWCSNQGAPAYHKCVFPSNDTSQNPSRSSPAITTSIKTIARPQARVHGGSRYLACSGHMLGRHN
eukprot:1160178-Pelagomonas_calceolata.AAC.5